VDIRRFRTTAEFLAVAGDFLAEREAEHNLIFGILSNLEADPTQYDEPPYLAAVVHGDRVVCAAIRTPPWRLVISEMDHPAAAHLLAEDLHGTVADDAGPPGVVGPAAAAAHFAEAWAERTGGRARLGRHERSFRLRRVIPPRPAPGELVRSRDEHRRVLADWASAFHDEAIGSSGRAQDWDAAANRWIRGLGRTAYLWVDGGRPVSLAGAGGQTPNGTRIGPVYTPPELRGRGYASNLVAGVSQLQLDAGRTFVFLFTDLANPTANKIYQAIGYEPVIDIDEYEFDPQG
jgi:GNAT superfamily N-acetyltransferase